MKRINSSKKRLSMNLLTTGCLLLLCTAFLGIPKAQAQIKDSMVIGSDTGYACSSLKTCCVKFTMNVHRSGTKWFTVHLQGTSGADPACLKLSCVPSTQQTNDAGSISTEHLSVTVTSSTGIDIDVWTDSANGWTNGTYVSFFLCRDSSSTTIGCEQLWSASDWWSFDDVHPNNTNPKDHNYGYDSTARGWCGSPTPCGPSCDVVDKTVHGSYVTFCVARRDWPNQADSIVVTFAPALLPCDSIRFTGDSSFRIHCDSMFLKDSMYKVWGGFDSIRRDTMVPHNYIPCPHADTVLQDWDSKRTDGAVTKMVFTPRSPYYKLAPCGTWCFTIKKCPSQRWITVKINTYPLGDTSGTCSSDTTGASMKKGSGQFIIGDESPNEQNYPNPLSWDNDFRTTIPFTLPSGGEVLIKVTNASGKVIKKESMTFSGSGKHFFYFTATDLPSGKYFYQIEYPKGNVIVNKSMILVK